MRATEWPEVPVIDLQASKRWALNGGPFGSKLVSRDYVEAGVPVIRGANLPSSRRFSFDDFVFVSEEKADDLLANNAHPGDVVFTQRGTLGQVGIIPKDSPYPRFVISQSQMKITVDEARVDPSWLFYCFRNPTTQQEMINRASTSGVPHINLGVLREFKLRLPSLAVQHRIASMLSAYDDLIENNTRRIAILEEMARRIYEEWFVRFRFPGHENVRMVESELGPVPEGWETTPITEVAEVRYGKNLPTKNLSDDAEFPVYGASKIIGRYGQFTRADRTLIVGCRGSVGAPQITLPRCFVTNNSFTFDPNNLHGMLWLYLAIQARGLEDVIGGAAQPQITLEGLSNAKLVFPTDDLVNYFDEMVRPLFSLAWNLADKNTNLRTTRDLLLPKLISGELDVSALPEPETAAA